MGMTKEEQRAAAARILAKEPLTPEEAKLAELYKRVPGSYVPPDKEETRTCGICGAKFRDTEEKGKVTVTALEKFTDHIAEHNPTPDKWTEAHKRIQAGKEWEKERNM
jgi:hypothetical protein